MLAAIIPATLIAVLLAWYFTRNRIEDLENSLQGRGNALVRQLAPASEYGVFAGNRELLRQLVDSTMREADVSGVAIIDANGDLLAYGGRPMDGVINTRPPPKSAGLINADREHLVFIAPVGHAPAAKEDPFESSDADSPRTGVQQSLGVVVIELSRGMLESRKRDLILGAAAITLIGLMVAGLTARWLSRGVTSPILQLAQTVGQLERGDLTARAEVRAGGVLKLLEMGINDMAESLAEARSSLESRIAAATVELQRQKDRAEQANQTKTQFLAAASHDLRQPLQALGMFTHALKRRVQDPASTELLDGIERGIASLENVLDALLDISKLDAGAVQPQLEDVPLAGVLENIRDSFRPTAINNDLAFIVVPTAAWCRTDPLLLLRILSNLVSNALRYTAQGGVVVGCRRFGSDLRIQVWDTGRGIAPERQKEIFREFVQIGQPERAHDKGLGLGLAIVDRLARLLGHAIRLRSMPGRGTVFEVIVPRVLPPAKTEEVLTIEDTDGPLACRRVLLVDDERDVLQALSGYLELRGAYVLCAGSGEEALELMRRQMTLPDLVISDFRLGTGDDGVSLLTSLRVQYRDLPGIILTGESSPDTLRILAESGFPMLSKPVHPQELEALITRVLRGQPAQDAGTAVV